MNLRTRRSFFVPGMCCAQLFGRFIGYSDIFAFRSNDYRILNFMTHQANFPQVNGHVPFEVSRTLLEKYNQAVPRYTSYPPANLFGPFHSSSYRQALEASNGQKPDNISIYIHIPFCHKICFYCGCNSTRMGQTEQVNAYVDAICRELEMVRQHLAPHRKVSQIHYGGGTPNAIAHTHLNRINRLIFDLFPMAEQPEIAIECHPGYLNEEYIKALVDARFNRVSLGIQDFNLQVLKTVNRDPSRLPVDEVMRLFRKYNADVKINLDFIYGLPGQSPESFAQTVSQAIAHAPDRIVTFSYAHVPWIKKYQEALDRAGLPAPDVKLKMFETGFRLMAEGGYREVGMDHFARPDDEMVKALDSGTLHRNFQGYCTRQTTGQVYAFGVSGISQLHRHYVQNTKDITLYIDTISRGEFAVEKGVALSDSEVVVREVINSLMCNRFVLWDELETVLGVDAAEIRRIVHFRDEDFVGLVDDGLVEVSDQGVRVTSVGRFFIRNVAVMFDPAFKGGNLTYSKSV